MSQRGCPKGFPLWQREAERRVGDLVGATIAVGKYVVDVIHVLLELAPALAHGRKVAVYCIDRSLIEHIAGLSLDVGKDRPQLSLYPFVGHKNPRLGPFSRAGRTCAR